MILTSDFCILLRNKTICILFLLLRVLPAVQSHQGKFPKIPQESQMICTSNFLILRFSGNAEELNRGCYDQGVESPWGYSGHSPIQCPCKESLHVFYIVSAPFPPPQIEPHNQKKTRRNYSATPRGARNSESPDSPTSQKISAIWVYTTSSPLRIYIRLVGRKKRC